MSCTAWVSSSCEIGRKPRSIIAAPGADLGDDNQIFGIGMQRLADQPVGDMRAVVVAGVDMVHSGSDGFAQHGQRRVMVPGWAKHAGSRELHGAVAKPFHGAAAEGERAGFVDAGHGRSLSLLHFSPAEYAKDPSLWNSHSMSAAARDPGVIADRPVPAWPRHSGCHALRSGRTPRRSAASLVARTLHPPH